MFLMIIKNISGGGLIILTFSSGSKKIMIRLIQVANYEQNELKQVLKIIE